MPENNQFLIQAEGLRKCFGRPPAQVHVLRGLDLEVRRGEFVAVMGPSGCGKSTLLHVLGLMTPPDEGVLRLDGQAVRDQDASQMLQWRRRRIGFVFQRFNLLGVLSAYDNVAISMRVRGLKMDGRADELFTALGVEHVRRRKPGQMSIGEQQRVAVVRALAHRPDLLLADEPTGNLDSDNSQALLQLFQDLHRQGQTIVMITHAAEAAAYAQRTLRMKDGRLLV